MNIDAFFLFVGVSTLLLKYLGQEVPRLVVVLHRQLLATRKFPHIYGLA